MMLFSALHSDPGTFHLLAAAVINICRADAPALRRNALESRIERLPPVPMGPQTRLRRRFSAVEANSYLTFFQLHSSSSATSIASPVELPCPISERAMRIVTISSGWITTQAVTSEAFSEAPFLANAEEEK